MRNAIDTSQIPGITCIILYLKNVRHYITYDAHIKPRKPRRWARVYPAVEIPVRFQEQDSVYYPV